MYIVHIIYYLDIDCINKNLKLRYALKRNDVAISSRVTDIGYCCNNRITIFVAAYVRRFPSSLYLNSDYDDQRRRIQRGVGYVRQAHVSNCIDIGDPQASQRRRRGQRRILRDAESVSILRLS